MNKMSHYEGRMRKIAFFAIILLLSVFITSCTIPLPPINGGDTGGGDKPTEVTPRNKLFYEYFDTVCIFHDYTGGSDEQFERLANLVEDELEICHKLFDIYNTYDGINNVKTVNDSAGGEPVKVDTRIIELLEFSKEMNEMTGGHVNVMMGSVLSIWHNYRSGFKGCVGCGYDGVIFVKVKGKEEKYREYWICPKCGVENYKAETPTLPSMEKLLSASEHTDINSLEINREAGTVRLTDPDALLDLGAVAKGFVAERIAMMLEAEGIGAYALDFGGNLRVGEKLSGEGWKTGIKNPDVYADDPYVRILTVKNASLVTSGSYERYYTVGGVRYHHIINKDTLMPANYYTSVSILAPTSAMADALSTALFNMTESEITELQRTLKTIEVTLVLPNGEVKVLPAGA
jgi:thiamine biosynthesis lipoprotein